MGNIPINEGKIRNKELLRIKQQFAYLLVWLEESFYKKPKVWIFLWTILCYTISSFWKSGLKYGKMCVGPEIRSWHDIYSCLPTFFQLCGLGSSLNFLVLPYCWPPSSTTFLFLVSYCRGSQKRGESFVRWREIEFQNRRSSPCFTAMPQLTISPQLKADIPKMPVMQFLRVFCLSFLWEGNYPCH